MRKQWNDLLIQFILFWIKILAVHCIFSIERRLSMLFYQFFFPCQLNFWRKKSVMFLLELYFLYFTCCNLQFMLFLIRLNTWHIFILQVTSLHHNIYFDCSSLEISRSREYTDWIKKKQELSSEQKPIKAESVLTKTEPQEQNFSSAIR